MARKITFFVITIIFVVLATVYFPYMMLYDHTTINKKMEALEKTIPQIEGLDSYLEKAEAAYPNLRKGLGKAISWNDVKNKQQTEYSFIYMPGFTATRKEIAPVVETLAKQFSANSYFSRLPSHGEEADDYSNARTEGFFESAMEAVIIGNKIGKKPIFVGLSTGATVLQYVLNKTGNAYAFITMSPAFYTSSHYMNVSLNPWVGHSLVKMVVGNHYHWKGRFTDQDLYWNTTYNTDIIPQITRVFQIASNQDYSNMNTPTFLIYNPNDDVADPKMMLQIFEQGRNPKNKVMTLDSRDLHVIAGDITSPENTQKVIDEVTSWIKSL